jgi:hypothetical protein
MAFDFAVRTVAKSLPRILKSGFRCGLTDEVNRPGVAGSGLNERLGRPKDHPTGIGKILFEVAPTLNPVIEGMKSLLFIWTRPPVENEKATGIIRVILYSKVVLRSIAVDDSTDSVETNFHGGLTIEVNRPSSGPEDERRRGSMPMREHGGKSLLGPG